MAAPHLTNEQRAFIQPLLPPPAHTGRPRADDRRTIEGILYMLITGCRWQDLPREYGAPTTVWRRLKCWGEAGVWERIWRTALAVLDTQGKLDWSMAMACRSGSTWTVLLVRRCGSLSRRWTPSTSPAPMAVPSSDP